MNFMNNKCSLKEIHEEDSSDNTLCNWREIKEMYSTGFVNIESHTLFHREIFRNLNIIDYITPNVTFVPYNSKGSPYYSLDNLGKTIEPNDFIGLTLFESAPLMIAGPKIKISPEFMTKGNTETIKICKELDIKSCFWGILDSKKINKPGDDPYYISRIKNDFIFRLPGISRKSFYSIYKYKLQRRLSGEKIY